MTGYNGTNVSTKPGISTFRVEEYVSLEKRATDIKEGVRKMRLQESQNYQIRHYADNFKDKTKEGISHLKNI